MKILLLTTYYIPHTTSAAKLVRDLAVEFTQQGHEVTVIVPDHTIKSGTQYDNDNGICVIRVKTGQLGNAHRLQRGYREMTLPHVIWKRTKNYFDGQKYDLIVYYSPTIFFGPLVERLTRFFNCHSYLILRDIFPQWAIDTGVIKKGLLYRLFKYFEKTNYEAADVIGVQAHGDIYYFADRGLDKKYRLEVLFNWMSLAGVSTSNENYREKLGLHDKIIFFYGGNIGLARDFDSLIRLAVRLKSIPLVHFLLVGAGCEVSHLQRQIQRLGLKNFSLHPSVDQDIYMKMVSDADVGLITLDRSFKTHNYPGKMLSYMYCAKPILASINPGNDLQTTIESHNAGLVCHNGDDESFYNKAIQLIENQDLRLEMGKNGRLLLENRFSVTAAASQILSHFTN